MSFNVRVFGYQGLSQVPEHLPKRFSADSVWTHEEPYLWSQVLSVDAVAVPSTVVVNTAANPDRARYVVIEVPPGQAVRFEVNPQGPNATTSRVASTNSRRLSGVDVFPYSPGMTFSFIDAAGLL